MSEDVQMLAIDQFFDLAAKRENMRINKESGRPWPWTNDPVLRDFRFCNLNREHDRTTTWFRENIRDPLRDQPSVLAATVAFRWFNLIRTGETLKPFLLDDPLDYKGMLFALGGQPPPHFTSAYVIQSPTGLTKVCGILWCIDNVARRVQEGVNICLEKKRLQALHEWLVQFPHMGPFMAYQVVCDIRYTALLEDATDINDWTCPGPGSTRGLGRIIHNNPDAFNYNVARERSQMIGFMRDILDEAEHRGVQWELSTVQHWLCEYDKWCRAQDGTRLKRRYQKHVRS